MCMSVLANIPLSAAAVANITVSAGLVSDSQVMWYKSGVGFAF